MKIGISFNYNRDNNQENVSKLLLVPEVKVESEDNFYDYYIEADTLEEFGTVLEKINKTFDYSADFIIEPNRLQIFIEFKNDN